MSSNPAQIDMVSRQAPSEFFECVPITDINAALMFLEDNPVDVMVVDEDLQDVSGVDLLIQARQIDPYTAFVLVVHEDLNVAVAADALAQIEIAKFLLAPYELDEWVECIEDAAHRYSTQVRTRRHLNLSKAKVRRLSRSVEQSKKDLLKKSRQLEQLRRAPVVPQPLPTPQSPTLTPDAVAKLRTKYLGLLSRIVLAGPTGPRIEALRKMAEHCAKRLRWPLREVNELSQATLLHHALAGEYPDEQRVEMRGGSSEHAAAMGRALGALPGCSDIADIITQHHGAPMKLDHAGQPEEAPRTARLLQILSLFDEIANDPKLLTSHEAEHDPSLGLTRASETLLRLAEQGRLDKELSEICVKTLIPEAMERDESCLSASDLEEDMVLSRTIYADNLVMVRAGVKLSESTLEKIRYADETQRFIGIWVQGSHAARKAS